MPPRVGCEKKGGRKKASVAEPELVPQLKKLVEDHTAGSSVQTGRVWTSRSCESLSDALAERGFPVTETVVESWSAAGTIKKLASDKETARVFLPGGKPPREGDLLRNPDLARALRLVRERVEYFQPFGEVGVVYLWRADNSVA